MKNLTKFLAAGVVACTLSVTAAFADSLDAARAAGQVGERADGMVGAVGSVPPAVAQTIAGINAQRLATYRSIAQKTGTPIDAVQKQAGDHLIAATPKGQSVMDGSWRKK
jgi:uncharacterized protein YdbL (DUF1318 family)